MVPPQPYVKCFPARSAAGAAARSGTESRGWKRRRRRRARRDLRTRPKPPLPILAQLAERRLGARGNSRKSHES